MEQRRISLLLSKESLSVNVSRAGPGTEMNPIDSPNSGIVANRPLQSCTTEPSHFVSVIC